MRLLRIHEVTRLTGLSRSSIYKQVRLKNFPDGVKITDRSTAWSSDEVENWIALRLSNRGLLNALEPHDCVAREEEKNNEQ
jgi:prophage regulatory protein